jgi:hypothetical protein
MTCQFVRLIMLVNCVYAVVIDCGSYQMPFQQGLDQKSLQYLYECCDDHDKCYAKCYGPLRSECDEKFSYCVFKKCTMQTNAECFATAYGLANIINLYGNKIYYNIKTQC